MKSMKPIRIMIVDNHKGVRLGVKTYLESQADFDLVAEASNGAEAITRYIKEKPDLVLMDLDLPDSSGITLMQDLHQVNVRIPVIILTSLTGFHLSEAVMSSGAVCMINKGVNGQVLASAIRDTMDKIENGSAWLRSSPGEMNKLRIDR